MKNLISVVFQVYNEGYERKLNIFKGCSKRFTQSSNLSAHEKVHMMKETPGAPGTGTTEVQAKKSDHVTNN